VLTIILLLTIPVTCVSFAFVYTEIHPFTAVLFVQSIVFLLFWLIVYSLVHKRQKKN
jgi:hypothetical protein